MAARRVAVTGLGLIDPFGESKQAFFSRLSRGVSHIKYFSQQYDGAHTPIPAVTCEGFDPALRLGRPLAAVMDRFSHLGVSAALEAWQDAGFSAQERKPREDCGVSWGTALGGTQAYENGLRDLWLRDKRSSPLSVVMGMNNACASHIAMLLGFGNSCMTYSVACSSAAAAIGEGYRRIRDGETNIMLTGGSDAPLLYGVIRAWEAMRVLAKGDGLEALQACRPFDRSRSGLVLGEGAAALVLEEWEHAVARGAPILCELAGYGANCDHVSLTRPNQDGQVRAMQLALEQAQVCVSEVGYLNAHGTATPEGDPIEIAALREVFGSHADRLPVSATKASHGHLMGTSGAIEAVISVMALTQDTLPPTATLQVVDPDCEGVLHIQGHALRGRDTRVVVSNTFAFGGSNAVLVFKR